MPARRPVEDRFWERVDKRTPDECWEWQGNKTPRGYGTIGDRDDSLYAHRLSYIFAHGEIPDGLYILHSCDNPGCVNPAHLRTGTQQDNINDALERGRIPKGEKSTSAKLTQEQAEQIRKLNQEGVSYKRLSKMFSITKSNIAHIVKMRSWNT